MNKKLICRFHVCSMCLEHEELIKLVKILRYIVKDKYLVHNEIEDGNFFVLIYKIEGSD